MPSDDLITIPQWAKQRKISKVRAYGLLKQRGIPTYGNPKKIRAGEANRMVDQYRDAIATQRMLAGGGMVAERERVAATVDVDPLTGEPVVTNTSLPEAQRQLAWEKVREAENKRRAAEGNLLDRDAVEREWSGHVAAVQSRLLLLPDKLAARVAVMSDVIRIRTLIDEEIRSAMEDLATPLEEETAA